MTETKRYRIRSYADDVAETVDELTADELSTVQRVLTNLGGKGAYAASFSIYEVDADGKELAAVMPL